MAFSILIFLTSLILCFSQRIPALWATYLDQKSTGYVRRFLGTFPNLLGCTWLSCYFLSGSFDYCMILLMPIFICMLSLIAQKHRDLQGFSNVLTCLITATGFACLLLPLLLPMASRLSIPFVSSTIAAIIIIADLILLPITVAGVTSIIVKAPTIK